MPVARPARAPVPEAPAAAPVPRRVLVVEDDPGIAAFFADVLAADGWEAERRESALGLGTLLRDWRPDVILLDLGLPYRSGGALLAELKADPATAGIPVVVVSAAPDALGAARRAQAAAVLTKPIGLQTLRAAVRAAAAGPGGPAAARPGQAGA